MNWFGNLSKKRASAQGFKAQKTSKLPQQTFILEPILTPSGLLDGGDDAPDPMMLDLDTPTLPEVEMAESDTNIEVADISEETNSTTNEDISLDESLDSAVDADLTDEEIQPLDFAPDESEVPSQQDSETTTDADIASAETEVEAGENISESSNTDTEVESIAVVQPDETTDGEEVAKTDSNIEAPNSETSDSHEEPTVEDSTIETTNTVETPAETANISEGNEPLEEGTIPESAVDDTSEMPDDISGEIIADDFAVSYPIFESGVFTVGESGKVEIDFLFDGGKYKGELAIFSLDGMAEFAPGSEAFIQEAASRALSSSPLGHIVISDAAEGARFSGSLGEANQNGGVYTGVKTFAMNPGDTFGVMLIPNGKVQQVFNNPAIGGAVRPLFSMVTANPNDAFHLGQIADITGDGNTFVMEDMRVDNGSDRDYNDIIFQVRGAAGNAALMDDVVASGKDWRTTDMGQALIAYAEPYITPEPVEDGEIFVDNSILIDPSTELVDFVEPPFEESDEFAEPGSELAIDEEEITSELVENEAIAPSQPPAEPETIETSSQAEIEITAEVIDAGEGVTSPSTFEGEVTATEVTSETTVTSGPTPVNSSSVKDNPVPTPEVKPVVEVTNAPETLSSQDSSSSEASPIIPQTTVGTETNTVVSPGESSVEVKGTDPSTSGGQNAIATNSNPVTTTSTPVTESQSTAVSPPQPTAPIKPPVQFEFPKESQPLIGVIDTGFSANNIDIDYSRIILGQDRVDGDANPLLQAGEGNEHGTHVLGIIGATQDNDVGIEGINDDAPLWVGRAIGSGKWAESLVEFVDTAKESGQPNAVVNLSLDLTQINPDGSVTTRYEFTPHERAAIEYARQHNVLIVVAAGNDGGVMSALGQSSQEFDNIITVGAAERVNDAVAVSKAYDRADYSSYGYGLDIMADGGTVDNPVLSTTGDSVGTMAGTSVASAKVTGAVSQVWAANPNLSYRQVIEILKNTATDLKTPGWDAETGAGFLNLTAAVLLAKVTTPEEYDVLATLIPETWSGEGKVIPTERAAATEFMGKYYEWDSYTIKSGDTLSAIALQTVPINSSSANYRNGSVNPFAYNWIGQCTWFAYGRMLETGLLPADAKTNGWFLGHAYKWERDAINAGLPITSAPKAGARGLVVWPPGVQGGHAQYGHVAFLEEVYPDGRIRISESNWAGKDIGERFLTPAQYSGLRFVQLENARTNPTNYAPPGTPGQTRQYIVRAGDTLSGIAQRELGNANRWREIQKQDSSTFTEAEARRLQVSQTIYLPVKSQVGTGRPVTPPPSSTPTPLVPDWQKAIDNEAQQMKSLLGQPTSGYQDATPSPYGTTGKYRNYQNGTVHWSPKYGAVALWYDLQREYAQYSFPNGSGGWLGFPTKREYSWNGGMRTDFEGGYIFWNGQRAKAYRPWESPYEEPTNGSEWRSTFFHWDRNQGDKPPVNFHENFHNMIAVLNLGSNQRIDGRKGLNLNWGAGSPKNNPRIPNDIFAVRSFTHAYFEAGKQYKVRVRADDGFQLLAKHHHLSESDPNKWVYFTPKDQWQQAYGAHQEITFTVPNNGWYDFHFHHYEDRGDAYIDLSWEEVNSNPSTGLPTSAAQATPFFRYQLTSGVRSSGECGPASLAMTLASLGLEPSGLSVVDSINNANDLIGSRARAGFTYDYEIERGIKNAGATPEDIWDWDALDRCLSQGKPFIAFGKITQDWLNQFSPKISNRDIEHIIAILGKTPNGKYVVADPVYPYGPVEMTQNQLAIFFKIYGSQPTGYAVARR